MKASGYPKHQHYFRNKGFNYTKEEVYIQMRKHTKRMEFTNELINFFISDLSLQLHKFNLRGK